MPLFNRLTFSEYEEASGLQRGQLWDCLTEEERQRLTQLGFRKRRYLPNGVRDYLLEIFPLPDNTYEFVSLTQYEKQCGFSKGELKGLLEEEQQKKLHDLGYRPFQKLPFRAILYLRSLGFY